MKKLPSVTLASFLVATAVLALPPTFEATPNPLAADSSLASGDHLDAGQPATHGDGIQLPPKELLLLTGGGKPGWVTGACVLAGGAGSGWAIAAFVAKRVGTTILCPTCGVVLAVVGFACLLI